MTLRLTELDASFLRIITPGKEYLHVEAISEAQGVLFLCPACFIANEGPVGTHRVLCWFLGRNVSDDESPKPGRWNALGTGLGDLTLQAGSSSILLLGGCRWHGFIRGGQVLDESGQPYQVPPKS